MAEIRPSDGEPFRAFVCHTINPYGFPAKDRSGRLEVMEKPHLGELMAKIRAPHAERQLSYATPNTEGEIQ
ncbi:MAG: hypothetical protein KGQ41_09705, partial [Alphaproteobacteria bacterium]|nr:hypothetical protein [Alphaproteobacteria bacterium]